MTGRRTALVAVLALVTLAGVGAASADVYPLGTHLDSNESVQQFEDRGVASTNLSELDVGLTVAKDHSKADIPGVRVDVNKVWVCVDYREDIPRTISIDIPAAYAEPRPGETQSVTSDHHISFRPTADGNATRATIEFDGAARACWSFRTSSGIYFGAKESIRELVNATTGFSLPTLASPDAAWNRVPTDAWISTTEVQLNTTTDATIQYDTANGSEQQWISVPDCSNPAEQAVCKYEQTNTTTGNASVTLLSTADSPPPVRYKAGTDTGALLGGALADALGAVERFTEDIGGLLGVAA
jgi:hypothetical protein